MFIKSIVLDGFKSYGNRVEITGFDPEFNAITGLNGTGKSNILDAICFVLGITNLSNVRAGSLQELIYKHGQAGITKATVSITFDNTNKAQQPIGYDSKEITVTRQVVMGGKNKYMINGNNVQNKRVIDLFCSVQLNVNNPHFLIMQGRITKVLNMKPPEILSMVEEAAGTRMYEAKKQSAEKIIEKKDAKLKELNDIIQEDIAPRLQKLQDERAQFQEYQKVTRELDTLAKLTAAWQYVTAEEKSIEAENKVKEIENQIEELNNTIEQNKQQMKDIDKEIDKLNRELDQESGGVLAELERALAAAEGAGAGAGAARRAAADAAAAAARRRAATERALQADEAALAERRAAESARAAASADVRRLHEESQATLAAATRRFLAVSSGLEGDSGSLQDRLMAAKKEAADASTLVSTGGMERAALQTRLRRAEAEYRACAAQHDADTATLRRQEALLQEIRAQVAALQYSEAEAHEAQAQARALEAQVRRQRDAAEALAARLQRCSFSYSPPAPDFDASKVHGTVCRLLEVTDEKYCTAVETAAGGKLYHVVVDSELTSAALLRRGRLTTRTTIIPLNKIRPYTIDAATVRAAQDVGGGPEHVQCALDLVTYPRSVAPAVAWVLGGTLVCSSLEVARRCTFHPRVRRRAVTLDGDVCDPAGTLAGGAPLQGGSVLVQLQQLRRQERALAAAEQELAGCRAALDAGAAAAAAYHQLKQREEMTSHELAALRARLATTRPQQLADEIAGLTEQAAALAASVAGAEAAHARAAACAADLQLKMDDIQGHRDRQFSSCERELAAARAAAERHEAEWRRHEAGAEALRLETLELEQAVAAARAQLDEQAAAQHAAAAELERRSAAAERAQEAVHEAQARVRAQRAAAAERGGAARALAARRDALAQAARDAELGARRLRLQRDEARAAAAAAAGAPAALVAAHPWIPAERAYFGQPGGAYDWAGRDGAELGARLAALGARRDVLARGLNARAHLLLGKEEECYREVLRKRRIVEADRAKLVQVMRQLDDKKARTLTAACARVTRDFASIFSSLIPGAEARLAPPPGAALLDGLEVRVGFNGAWKASLAELSGGQRSLVALALVLALLLFQPAPLYILDEVDAALDLSHTQNIGIMLKEHFKHSQFIVVSLKDGMFNNANVLFRTKFVDGMSSVQRTVNRK